MTEDKDILLQINVRKKAGAPLGLEATIDKCPENAVEILALLNLVILASQKTINDFSMKRPQRYADEDLR